MDSDVLARSGGSIAEQEALFLRRAADRYAQLPREMSVVERESVLYGAARFLADWQFRSLAAKDPGDADDDASKEWSRYHEPSSWRRKWGEGSLISETKWRKYRDEMGVEKHQVSGSRLVRFKLSELKRLGLSEPG